jgi:hypothetical protein
MHHTAITAFLFVATACHYVDKGPRFPRVIEGPKATRVIEGSKSTFPTRSIPEGVKLLTRALESCHVISDGTVTHSADDMKRAQIQNHVHFLFPTPLRVKVLGKNLAVSEAVVASGVFWLRCGNEVVRCTKYTHDKMQPLHDWYRQTLPAD